MELHTSFQVGEKGSDRSASVLQSSSTSLLLSIKRK